MSQWDYKIDQPMPGPFPFPNSRKGPGIEVGSCAKKRSPIFRGVARGGCVGVYRHALENGRGRFLKREWSVNFR